MASASSGVKDDAPGASSWRAAGRSHAREPARFHLQAVLAVTRRKSFVYDMFPQDFNDGVKGFSPATIGIYVMLINLMRVEQGPLPPRRLRKRRDEMDEWIRDKLGLKNVKTWLKAKAELLDDPDKLVELPDGRVANPRTERDLAGKRKPEDGGSGESGGGDGGGQQTLRLVGKGVDEPVRDAGERAASPEVIEKIGGSFAEVPAMGAAKPLILRAIGCASPSPCIPVSLHEVAAVMVIAARARGDPASFRA